MSKHTIYLLGLIFISFLYACKTTNEAKVSGQKYKERFRPQIHFTPESKWMNDPNGMVYFEGEYHLFYQHYPDSAVWGPMHWGHAISKNLITWEQLPIALYPDSLGWIFSGSAVIDWKNTSKLGKDGKVPMIAIYTYHNSVLEKQGANNFQSQGLAYSLDKGRTWTKYAKNPILPNPGIRDFRDPKVSWSDEYQQWFMIIAVVDHTEIYSSDNLLSWKKESEFGHKIGAHGGVWECPDLFPIVETTTGKNKWVMLVSINPGAPNGGSGTQYFVGDFDGHNFVTNQKDTKWIDYGKDNYAGVTWSDIPKADGRRLFMGWMNNWQYARDIPTAVWRGAGTLPRSLDLVEKNGDFILTSQLIKEFDSLVTLTESFEKKVVNSEITLVEEAKFPSRLNISFDCSQKLPELFGITFTNSKKEKVAIGYDSNRKSIFIDNRQNGWNSPNKDFAIISYAPFDVTGKELKLSLIIDKSSVELFVNDGELVMTNQFFPTEEFTKITLLSEKGAIKFNGGTLEILKSIW